eukprot:3224844-Rhodomonas_salina.8
MNKLVPMLAETLQAAPVNRRLNIVVQSPPLWPIQPCAICLGEFPLLPRQNPAMCLGEFPLGMLLPAGLAGPAQRREPRPRARMVTCPMPLRFCYAMSGTDLAQHGHVHYAPTPLLRHGPSTRYAIASTDAA